MSSDARKFLKGVTSGYLVMIISLLVNLWLIPFVLKFLTRPEYGIFAIATDLLAWLSLANLGISAAFNSKGAHLMGSKNVKELNIVASTTFFTQLVSAIVIILAGIFVTVHPELLFGNDVNADNIELVVVLLVSGYTLSFIFQPMNSMLIASKQIHIDNYLKFGLLIIKTSLTVILLMNGFKLLSLAISSFVATIIITIVTWVRVKKSLPYVKIKLSSWKYNRFSFLLKKGVWFSLGGVAGILILRMDSFLIGKYISLSTVASYVITIKLYQIADTFHQQFFNTTRPFFAQMFGKKDMKSLAKMYNITFYSSFAAAFGIGICIYLLNKWFVYLWVGSDFYLGDTINMLLCLNFILQASVLPNRIILATTFFKIASHNIIRFLEGVIKLLVSIALLYYWGIEGIIFAGLISSLVFSNIVLNIFTSQFFKEIAWNKLTLILFISIIPVIILFVTDFQLKLTLFAFLIVSVFVFVWRKIRKQNINYSSIDLKFVSLIKSFLLK